MGYRHSPDEILEAAVGLALESGLGALTFGGVGRRLSISDRTVVYYFPTKTDLLSAVVATLVRTTQDLLEEAFGSEPLARPEILRRAWPVLSAGNAEPVFRVYFELVGLASAGQDPYVGLAAGVAAGWVTWLVPRMLAEHEDDRRRQALATLAQIEGLLLVRQMLGPEDGAAAAEEAGVAG